MSILQQRLKASQNPNRAKRYPPEVKALAVELFVDGHPVPAIADRLGASRPIIRRWLEKAAAEEAGRVEG